MTHSATRCAHLTALSWALALAFIGTSSRASAADIVNGWSGPTNISKMHSHTSLTLFKLNGVANGCGHPDQWMLPLTDSIVHKAKLSQLLAAFMTQKTVNVRCENGQVTDFEIFE